MGTETGNFKTAGFFNPLIYKMPRGGIEPSTQGFSESPGKDTESPTMTNQEVTEPENQDSCG